MQTAPDIGGDPRAEDTERETWCVSTKKLFNHLLPFQSICNLLCIQLVCFHTGIFILSLRSSSSSSTSLCPVPLPFLLSLVPRSPVLSGAGRSSLCVQCQGPYCWGPSVNGGAINHNKLHIFAPPPAHSLPSTPWITQMHNNTETHTHRHLNKNPANPVSRKYVTLSRHVI